MKHSKKPRAALLHVSTHWESVLVAIKEQPVNTTGSDTQYGYD